MSDTTKAVLLGLYLMGAVLWALYYGSLHLSSRAHPDQYWDGTVRWSARGALLTPLWPAALLVVVASTAGKWLGQLTVDATKEDE